MLHDLAMDSWFKGDLLYGQCSQHTAHALNIQEHTIRLRSVPENHNVDCSYREVSYTITCKLHLHSYIAS